MPSLPPKTYPGTASAPALPPRPSVPRDSAPALPPRPSAPRGPPVASHNSQPGTHYPSRGTKDTDRTPIAAADAVQSDDLSTLTTKLGGLGIEPPSPPPASASPTQTATNGTGPIQPREVRDKGEPQDDVQFCPGLRVVSHSIKWYYMSDEGEAMGTSLTCSRCYQDFIAPTSLAGEWSSEVWGEGKNVMCCFAVPRVKQVLWPEAVKSCNSLELRSFLTKISSLEACPREKSVTGVKGTKWYGLREGDIQGFEACETCYEMYVAGTSFAVKFAYFQEPAEEHTWTCCLRRAAVGGISMYMAERDDWQGFITAAFERLQLPKCTGEEVQSGSCSWYLAKDSMGNAPVCATCYEDSLSRTPFAHHFRPYRPQFDQVPSPGLWRCSLATMPAEQALEATLERCDFEVFAETMRNIAGVPQCTKQGIVNGKWWTLVGGGCPGFAICFSCFAGIFWTRGLDNFLETATPLEGETYLCSFHPTHPRFNQYLQGLYQAVDRGVFAYLSDHVRKVSEIRVCGGNGGFANSQWWGYPESYFCEDCYVTYVKDTCLGEHLPLNGVVVEAVTFCQIWSPRMRSYWNEACEAGEPGSAESVTATRNFRIISKHRSETYHKTLSEIEVMKKMKDIQRQNAMMNAQLSIQYQGMAGMSTALGQTSDYKYGNGNIGWYDSSAGAESRILFGKFQDGLVNSLMQPSELQRIIALQKIWKEVE